jgi:6-phosphogluconolactonase
MNSIIQVYSNLEELSQAAASFLWKTAAFSIQERGKFLLALSGGETSRRTYELLASPEFRDKIDWRRLHIFWGDERFVPPDDPRCNQRMAREAWLNHVPIPPQQIHPIPYLLTPMDAAAEYEGLLRGLFDSASRSFDLTLLGLGVDAHTASLFPHDPAVVETKRWVCAVQVPGQEIMRITLTLPILNQSHQIAFLVSGAAKAPALKNVFQEAENGMLYPAKAIRSEKGQVLWLLDKEAAVDIP